jgi:hypothetical protein
MTSSNILHYIWSYTFPFLSSLSSHTHYNMTKHLSSEHIQHVLTFLDKHTPYCQIEAQTHVGSATISCIRAEHCPELPCSIGGHPNLLSPADQRHAIRLVTVQKLPPLGKQHESCHRSLGRSSYPEPLEEPLIELV